LVADTVADQRWLAAMWPFVRGYLPAAPARVLELGCGPLGGFVPRMRALGYDAIGVDPDAPEGPDYDRAEFERRDVTDPLDALVACTSLHHVAGLGVVLDRIHSMLEPGGTVVVVEWAHERFDEAAARWCFDRLAAGNDEGWLYQHRNRWRESGRAWDGYFRAWVSQEQLHAGRDIMGGLRARFDTRAISEGPYFLTDLDGVTRADEEAAIDAGLIQAAGLHYVGQRRAGSRVGG
jgi:SAM-dependent methyltransferase